jgi:hypothetical protein
MITSNPNDTLLARTMRATGKTDALLEREWWTERRSSRHPVNFWVFCRRQIAKRRQHTRNRHCAA